MSHVHNFHSMNPLSSHSYHSAGALIADDVHAMVVRSARVSSGNMREQTATTVVCTGKRHAGGAPSPGGASKHTT